MSAAKRQLDEYVVPDAQRRRSEKCQLIATLEHQPNIGRLTIIVRGSLPLLDAPQCTVSSSATGASAMLGHASCDSLAIALPWTAESGIYVMRADEDRYVLSISAARTGSGAGATQTPWSAVLSRPPTGVSCAICGNVIAQFGVPAHVRPLPAESWEELVDAWMCHGDQRLNLSVLQGKEGVGASNTPVERDIWLGSMLAKIANTHLCGTTQSPTACRGPWEGDAYALHCYECGNLVGGQLAMGVSGAAQLLLYATVPSSAAPATAMAMATEMPPLPGPMDLFAPIIASYLVEQGERHAAHHFIVEEFGTPRLVLWLFQPLVELVTAPPTRHYRAAKILYREADGRVATQLDAVSLTLGSAHVKLLYDILLDSTKWSAPSQLGPWAIGWLPRT
ncbi:HECT-type E3 ubiquitin transferase [Malassezia cuniculi]|uniref:HECT-type E3 ubiquitin transferase n=1 Tax=Malassezia cuniculi TaxID=948313 RepID=A0AAF0J718_9BASI|nr:HECT-type E3 ubiquitin transferase [Malassezia cuniculi]